MSVSEWLGLVGWWVVEVGVIQGGGGVHDG